MLLPSPPSITPGGPVQRRTESALPLHFSNPQSPTPMKPKSPTRKSNLRAGHRNGRPALPEEERQSYVRHTRYNEAEKHPPACQCQAYGNENVSEYIRSVTLNPHIVPRLDESEMRIVRTSRA